MGKKLYLIKKDGRKITIIPSGWIDSDGDYCQDIRRNPTTKRFEYFSYFTGFEKYAEYLNLVYGKTVKEVIEDLEERCGYIE
ncbi:MAG: hypothetical protein K0A90_00260 [Methanosarcinaceae archaeon]|nr:hypothetical protein [Methanosarcinaceae archaeon]